MTLLAASFSDVSSTSFGPRLEDDLARGLAAFQKAVCLRCLCQRQYGADLKFKALVECVADELLESRSDQVPAANVGAEIETGDGMVR